jgi:hypothetical protein
MPYPATYHKLSVNSMWRLNPNYRSNIDQLFTNFSCRNVILRPNTLTGLYLVFLVLQSGDLELNPGPQAPKYPCMECGKAVRGNQYALQCDDDIGCARWVHTQCIGMNTNLYKCYENSNAVWVCCQCGLPNFGSGLFMDSGVSTISTSNSFEELNVTPSNLNDLAPPWPVRPPLEEVKLENRVSKLPS